MPPLEAVVSRAADAPISSGTATAAAVGAGAVTGNGVAGAGATGTNDAMNATTATATTTMATKETDTTPEIPVTSVEMKLLDVRLQSSKAVIKSVLGDFVLMKRGGGSGTASGTTQVCLALTGGVLELYEFGGASGGNGIADVKNNKLHRLQRIETHSIIRDIVAVRWTGEKRDVLAVTSDAGTLTIIDFATTHNNNNTTNTTMSSVLTTFGKTGCRRSTPGHYVCADPKGRAVMVSALEKRKLVYVLNHNNNSGGNGNGNDGPNNNNNNMNNGSSTTQIASPLEAHKSRTIVFATCGVDNGYDNPIFAVLEQTYRDDTEEVPSNDNDDDEDEEFQKQLVYYELDLGLNHVSRKWATPVPSSACSLAALPGGADGPSGVLVGSENFVSYYHPDTPSPSSWNKNGNADADAAADDDENTFGHGIHCVIPRRKWEHPTKDVLVTHLVIHRQKKGKFFGLAQTELGDVYKISMDLQAATSNTTSTATATSTSTGIDRVVGIRIAVLDTLPPCTSLNISKKGMLFGAAEFGSHHPLYQFQRIDLPDAPTNHSDDIYANITTTTTIKSLKKLLSTDKAVATAKTFVPSTQLQNLIRVDALDNASCPTTSVLVGELAGNEVSPQIYTLSGTGNNGSARLNIARHGASVTELAVSELPGIPGGLFTIPHSEEGSEGNTNNGGGVSVGGSTKYIVVSFADATLVLGVGDTVEELGRETGFLTNAPTLACSALRGGSVCQIHPSGVRHIQGSQAKQWHCPGLKRIECASANFSQVLIALAGGEVTYFELDALNGQLTETATREMGADVCCLDIASTTTSTNTSAATARSLLCAVGCRDATVKIVSLEPGSKMLQQKSSLACKARPHSISLQSVGGGGDSGTNDFVLHVGLEDGSSLRVLVDPITGTIGNSSPTRRFLGARPVSISKIQLDDNSYYTGGGDDNDAKGPSTSSLLLLSSRPWISRTSAQGKHHMVPLSYTPLDHGCAFASEAVPQGIVATAGKTLRIISISQDDSDNGGGGGGSSSTAIDDQQAFHTNSVPLRYTPRQMTLLSSVTSNNGQAKVVLACVESDTNDYGLEEKESLGYMAANPKKKGKGGTSGDGGTEDAGDDAMDMDEDSDEEDQEEKKEKNGGDDDEEEESDEEDEDEKTARQTPVRGPRPPGPGHWGSCIRLMDPSDGCRTLECIEMSRNEAALCCCSVRFHTRGGESLLAVGTVTGLKMSPLKHGASHVLLYRVLNGERLQLLHRTLIEDGPVLTLAHFQGRLLVGIGKTLRLYEMGKRQLLRKCELRGLPTMVKTLQTAGDRAYVGDMLRSLHMVKYEATSNRLVIIANDPSPRPIVCQELLDFNTVAVGDKFGNIFVLRLPRGAGGVASAAATMDVTGQRALWDTSSKTDTTATLQVLCQYYVGEVVTGMTRSSLVAGGAESLIYVTVTGRIGALVPFASREDVEFYTQLEGHLRTDAPRVTGRDPHAYRSYYAPTMHVVDGDLCEAFSNLSVKQQAEIAEQLDRTVGDVLKKLEDTRNSLL